MKKVPDAELVDLRNKLKFSFETGEIWLGENRMVLMHVAALGALRNEIIESCCFLLKTNINGIWRFFFL